MTIYEAAGGMEGLVALARAWHARCLNDPVMNHPFSHPGQHPKHIERLAAYWAEALGGPADYTTAMGTEAALIQSHAGGGQYPDLERAAIVCFDAALSDVGIVEEPLRTALHDYFAWSTHRLTQHSHDPADVPKDAALPHWSWDGAPRR